MIPLLIPPGQQGSPTPGMKRMIATHFLTPSPKYVLEGEGERDWILQVPYVVYPVFHLLTCLELYEGVREFPSFNFYSEGVKFVVPNGPASFILSPVKEN